MQLPLLSFSTLVSNAAAAVQGSARQLIDLSVGSTLRAILEANASLALWLQWLIVQVLRMTRAATSSGPDLDSWVGDFGLSRFPAIPSAGRVQLSRFTGGVSAFVPVGLSVRTTDGLQTFGVVAETAHPAWEADPAGYRIDARSLSVDVPVLCNAPGTAGNVRIGSITLIAAALPGVDTVANADPTAGGMDAEDDESLRARFRLFLDTRARATPLAVGAAVLSCRQGLTFSIDENVDLSGRASPGTFIVTVDDGTGAPTADIINQAAAAIELVRPIATRFAVRAPSVRRLSISLLVVKRPGFQGSDVLVSVSQAISGYVDSLPIAVGVFYSRLIQVAYDASPGVANIMALTLDGDMADIAPARGCVLKVGSLQVSGA